MISAVMAGLTAALMAWLAPARAAPEHFGWRFISAEAGEAFVTVRAGCARCDWGEAGREAVALRVSLDGQYSQHLVLARGETPADYRIALGPVTKGGHRLDVDRDLDLSAPGAGPVTIAATRSPSTILFPDSTDFRALSMAPILYARPNTVGRFTDLPLLTWCEVVPTPRGRQYRYSVIFSNEDGGTQTDRLMATWGRTTDIEFVYGAEVNDRGEVIAEEFQGPGHDVPAFTGRHQGRHPLLWVSTDNNMVSESGSTGIRYAPAPVTVDLTGVSREAVMDANPWTYAIASLELRREGKIADDPPPGRNRITDPRRFVYVEACGTIGNAALALSVGVSKVRPDPFIEWIPSDRGLTQYRIVRDGCFRIATPVPADVHPSEIRLIRVQAFDRPPAADAAPVPADPVRLMRVNRVFMLDEHYVPRPSLLRWEGPATITAGGDPLEVWVR